MLKRLLCLVILPLFCHGQNNPRFCDYSTADSIALNIPKKKYKSYTELAIPLTENLHTEHEKFRAIFRWITNNINYSYSNKTNDPDKVIQKGIAVCSGYASLLKAMCNSVGIECEIITGYTKTTVSDINKPLSKTDHAWNSVKLNDQWYLVDVTWAWGYKNQKNKFVKAYDNTYFLSDEDFFNKKHFPEDKKWSLTEKKLKKSKFKEAPLFHENYTETRLNLLTPKKGTIIIKQKESLDIEFTTTKDVSDISYLLGKNKFVTEIHFTKTTLENGEYKYSGKISFDKKENTLLAIFINRKHTLSYKLIVK